jgi:hypothetical protein
MKRKWLLIVAANAGVLLLTLAGLEVWCRLTAPPDLEYYRLDDELGWLALPNVTARIDGKGFYRTNAEGFREWGDVTSKKTKILFVGDSFTGHPYTSNDDAYFSLIRKDLDVEVFAAGGGGYGTLQELMLIKRFIGKINPDLLVLQFCYNDFTNNSYEIEETRREKYFRPYWIDGSAKLYPARFFRFLYVQSYFFRYAVDVIENIELKYYEGTERTGAMGDREKKFDRAEELTLMLLREIAAVVPSNTRRATFNCQTRDPDLTARWMRVATAAGFLVWPNVSAAVERQERETQNTQSADGWHLNPFGNQIVAWELEKEIISLMAQVTK